MSGQFVLLKLVYGSGRGIFNVVSEIEYESLGSGVSNGIFIVRGGGGGVGEWL
jgi:hypothetical protein